MTAGCAPCRPCSCRLTLPYITGLGFTAHSCAYAAKALGPQILVADTVKALLFALMWDHRLAARLEGGAFLGAGNLCGPDQTGP